MVMTYNFVLLWTMLSVALAIAAEAQPNTTDSADMQAIEKLHQKDIAATLSGDPQALADLFTDDAVLLQPGSPAIVGRQAILYANEEEKVKHPSSKVLAYKPEIHDLQVAKGWAFEWTDFEASYKESENEQPKSFHAKALRVLKHEADGDWKFSRVMWNLSP
jgi:uncharacterized protein (TIGR02246 family)